MAKKPTTELLDAKRVANIARDLYNTCQSLSAEKLAEDDAKEALDDAKAQTTSKRETIMGLVAELAYTDSWTLREIDVAAGEASKLHNDLNTKKAIQTFIGEVKHAAHPLVREHFTALKSIRDAAWDQESEQLAIDKAAPAPLRRCFKRRYHALVGAMLATTKGAAFYAEDDLVRYARAHDPSLDAQKVFKEITAIIAKLDGMYVSFPADDLGHAKDILGKITWNELRAAQLEREEEANARYSDSKSSAQAENITPPAGTTGPDSSLSAQTNLVPASMKLTETVSSDNLYTSAIVAVLPSSTNPTHPKTCGETHRNESIADHLDELLSDPL